MFGGAGNDTFHGQGGADRLYGGKGSDALYGGNSRDFLRGDAGNDTLDGGGQKDQLLGGKGADDLHFSAGNDTMRGQGGKDDFVFRDAVFGGEAARAQVLDFQDDVDQIVFFRGAKMRQWEDAQDLGSFKLNPSYIVSNFLFENGEDVVLKFAGSARVVFKGIANAEDHLDDIVIL